MIENEYTHTIIKRFTQLSDINLLRRTDTINRGVLLRLKHLVSTNNIPLSCVISDVDTQISISSYILNFKLYVSSIYPGYDIQVYIDLEKIYKVESRAKEYASWIHTLLLLDNIHLNAMKNEHSLSYTSLVYLFVEYVHQTVKLPLVCNNNIHINKQPSLSISTQQGVILPTKPKCKERRLLLDKEIIDKFTEHRLCSAFYKDKKMLEMFMSYTANRFAEGRRHVIPSTIIEQLCRKYDRDQIRDGEIIVEMRRRIAQSKSRDVKSKSSTTKQRCCCDLELLHNSEEQYDYYSKKKAGEIIALLQRNGICALGSNSGLDIGTEGSTFLESIEEELGIKMLGLNIDDGSFSHYNEQFLKLVSSGSVILYDGIHIPFDDGKFSLMTMISVIHHIIDENLLDLSKEIYRVCSVNGYFVIKDVDLTSEERVTFYDFQHEWYEGIFEGEPSYRNETSTLRKTVGAFLKAGFNIVSIDVNDDFVGNYWCVFKKSVQSLNSEEDLVVGITDVIPTLIRGGIVEVIPPIRGGIIQVIPLTRFQHPDVPYNDPKKGRNLLLRDIRSGKLATMIGDILSSYEKKKHSDVMRFKISDMNTVVMEIDVNTTNLLTNTILLGLMSLVEEVRDKDGLLIVKFLVRSHSVLNSLKRLLSSLKLPFIYELSVKNINVQEPHLRLTSPLDDSGIISVNKLGTSSILINSIDLESITWKNKINTQTLCLIDVCSKDYASIIKISNNWCMVDPNNIFTRDDIMCFLYLEGYSLQSMAEGETLRLLHLSL